MTHANFHQIKKVQLIIAFVILQCAFNSSGQTISSAANNFINSLTPSLKGQAMFPLEDEERFNMNFVPMVRKGPTFHDFNEVQKKAALDLLKLSLSNAGYAKVAQIMELERVLRALEGDATLSDGRDRRDPLNYHYCIFGTPSAKELWAWRFEGHHLSLNFVCSGDKIVSSTPSFMGSNPAIVRSGDERGKQVLKQEMLLGFELVNSLTKDQLGEARFSDRAPSEIITGTDRKIEKLKPNGLRYTSLDQKQKDIFMKLLMVYVENYELGFSHTLMNKIKTQGIDNLYFAWAGALQPGDGEYYRIQGPMLLIEYDNTQNDGNHVHTIVRDLTNDFAEDILREHYQNDHK
jgi:hypothetical protein